MRQLAPYLLATVAIASASEVRAETDVRTQGTTWIDQPVGVNLAGVMALQGPSVGSMTSTTTVSPPPVVAATGRTASLTLSGGAADAVSLDYPGALDLAREGGIETLQLQMTQGDGYAPRGSTVLSLEGGVSFRVGGGVEAPVNPIVPGNYRGLLVIVAQWN